MGKVIKTTIREFLNENVNDFDEDDVEKWISGECIPFTVALNEIFPQYQIAVLNDEYNIEDEDIEYNFNFVHAFCYDPKNYNIIIDAKGIRKLRDLYDDFYDINPVIDWDIPNSKFLIDNFTGKEFYSEESYDYDVSEYQEAKEWIKNHINSYQIK
jgi:hypothetical protein